jgi:hypothetical protein
MNMGVIEGFWKTTISREASRHLSVGSLVVSVGLACFGAVKEAGCAHHRIVSGGGVTCITLTKFTWVNTLIGNMKNAMTSTYHSIDH